MVDRIASTRAALERRMMTIEEMLHLLEVLRDALIAVSCSSKAMDVPGLREAVEGALEEVGIET